VFKSSANEDPLSGLGLSIKLLHAVILRMSLARCQEEKLPYGTESIIGAVIGPHE